MSTLAGLPDPTDLPAVRAALEIDDPDGRLVPLGLQKIVIAPDAVTRVVEEVPGGPVVVLVDATPITRDGADLKALVHDALAARFPTETVVLGGDHLHVDDAALDAARAAVAGAAAVVSVGGGTVTDIAKVATPPDVPLVVVQTAASVDGYTDNVSVVLRDGVKRTVPSRWPDVVLSDVTTIAGAPARLTTAGFGEVQSMFCAPADWYLAHAFGMGDWDPVPADLLARVGRGIADWAPGVAAGDPAAVERLVRVLAARGLAGGLVGSTACLSGVEHVVSHMLDMLHDARGVPVGLHGAQVGVASVVSAAAWEHLLAEPPTAVAFPDPDSRRDTVLAAFADLDPTGARGAECWADYRAKLTRWAAARPTVEAALADWDRHRAVLQDLLAPAATIAAQLHAAGAVTRFADLDPAVDDATAHWAVGHCHLMRDRFTVVDLLDALGRWTGHDRDAILAAADKAVA